MASRHPNPRLAKIHRSYSVEDMARLFNVHKNTIRSWLKRGVEPIDDQRPALIRGAELPRFPADRRGRAKQVEFRILSGAPVFQLRCPRNVRVIGSLHVPVRWWRA
jgi:hypothetical protein